DRRGLRTTGERRLLAEADDRSRAPAPCGLHARREELSQGRDLLQVHALEVGQQVGALLCGDLAPETEHVLLTGGAAGVVERPGDVLGMRARGVHGLMDS